jgi:hypothetical protein
MKKILLVVSIVMLASLIASAQLVSPTVFNRTYSGYCDGAHLVLQKLTATPGAPGSTKVYVGGFHDLVDACGFASNAPIVGNKSGAGSTVQPHPLVGVAGPVLYTADADKDAQCNCFSGIQFEFVYDLVHGFSAIYESFLGFDGDYFCCNQSLVPGLPAKVDAAGKPPAGGTFAIAKKQE